MISNPTNRVQAIKSKFENLNIETTPTTPKKQPSQLYKLRNDCERKENKENTREVNQSDQYSKTIEVDTGSSSDDVRGALVPNSSSLYKIDVKRSVSDSKTSLSRQTSDPGKKLHRSHAFRCDRNQKLNSPKRHGSCNGRSETSEFLKMERKLSRDRLKKLSNVLEQQMKKDNFVPFHAEVVGEIKEIGLFNSIPDEDVPPHILQQYAKVIKPKKDDKNEVMTDSGVSSETENLEEDKGRVKKIMNRFESIEKTELPVAVNTLINDSAVETNCNLDVMEELAGSSETMKLERKNPHLKLTDTLKKALKQPLPAGPPPKKPPRTFTVAEDIEREKNDAKRKLEKLEQVLMKREARKESNIYDIAEENLSLKRPKEIHYLSTEILEISQRTQNNHESPLKNCFNKLNCSVRNNSVSSLPYTRLSTHFDSNRSSQCDCPNSDKELSPLRTFMSEKCSKCCVNEDKDESFKCHLKCSCREEKSKFFLDEHIYDEPCVTNEVKKVEGCNMYGTLNSVKLNSASESLDDLREDKEEDTAIYELPCDVRPPAPEEAAMTDFQKLRKNFENGSIAKDNRTKSTENIYQERFKKSPERKFATEVRRYRPREAVGSKFPKKNPQLDVDRENLNRLMNEIYETVTAACNMEENKPGSFPTENSDGSASEESVKLTRSLTEKRKNYVRRVSSRLAYLEPKNIKQTRYRHQTSICSYRSETVDNPYSTFRSWKSFRASQNNLARDKMETDSKFNLTDSTGNILSLKKEFDVSDDSMDNLSIDEKIGCVDIELPFEPRENGLFNICLLVGLNHMNGEAYVKSVFPSQVQVPPHIESLVFPETLCEDKGEWSADAQSTQCYSFVLTDERGERSYGYCRRVLPEGATSCLPLCYCLIGKYRAPGFYYKVLHELESHHGSSDEIIQSLLQQLFDMDFPNPGEEITLTYHHDVIKNDTGKNEFLNDLKITLDTKLLQIRDLSEAQPDLMAGISAPDLIKCKTMPDMRTSGDYTELNGYYDLDNNNRPSRVFIGLDKPRTKSLKRPLEPRAEEVSASQLLDSLGAGLLIKVFGSLLLERKIIIRADTLSAVSRCLEALQAALYPFVWQQPLISLVPGRLQGELLHAPVPLLAGMRAAAPLPLAGVSFEEGMFIDINQHNKVLFYQGDESTILPANSFKTLKTTLQMEIIRNKDKGDEKTRNVMISEAFLRFFVDILGDFWKYFKDGPVGDGLGRGDVVFDKDSFIKNAASKQNQYFLEWFTETAMFNHFIQNMAVRYKQSYAQKSPKTPEKESRLNSLESVDVSEKLIDTPTPNFYQLFEERVLSRRNSKGLDRSGYKNALNKKVKLLKSRLKDLVG